MLPHNLLHVKLSEYLLEIYCCLLEGTFLPYQICLHVHSVFPQIFKKWISCFLNMESLNCALFVSNNPLRKGWVMCNKDKCTLAQTGYKRQNTLEVSKPFAFCLCIFMILYIQLMKTSFKLWISLWKSTLPTLSSADKHRLDISILDSLLNLIPGCFKALRSCCRASVIILCSVHQLCVIRASKMWTAAKTHWNVKKIRNILPSFLPVVY